MDGDPRPGTLLAMRHACSTALVAVAVAVGLPSAAHAARPDLVADPVTEVAWHDEVHDSRQRRLLRFDGYIHNAGPGPLEVRGSGRAGNDMQRVDQIIEGEPARADIAAGVLYENGDFHNHWHLKAIARYSLGLPGGGAEVAPAMKVGFCLLDSERISGTVPLTHHAECEKNRPGAESVGMGISSGWRDVYHRNLLFQWVDVSDVQPGRYEVRSQIDPEGYIAETDEANPVSAVPVELRGYVARGRTLTRVPAGAPTEVALGAASYGAPAAGREVRIDTAPQQGTLDVATGQWVDAASVTYTPKPGATGTDAFTFAARDAGSAFPRSPASATVSLGLEAAQPPPSVDGPERVTAGTSVQLTGPAGSAWAVDGIPGGDLRVGTVTPKGLFTAPAVVPDGGTVAVSITTADGRSARKTLSVVARPPLEPAPAPDDPAFFVPAGPPAGTDQAPAGPTTQPPVAPTTPNRPSRATIKSFGAQRSGPIVAAAVLANRTGRLRVDLRRGKRRVAICRTRVRAGVPQICRLRIPRGAEHGRFTVRATLAAGGRTVVRARRVAPAAHGH